MRATKLIHGLKGLSYKQRLERLKLPTLKVKYRRLRGDMIVLFKMVTGKYDPGSCINFKYVNHPGTQTRGNEFKNIPGSRSL